MRPCFKSRIFFTPMLPSAYAPAFDTGTMSIPCCNSIVLRKLMTSLTTSSTGVYRCRTSTTQLVFPWGYRFKVIRVHTKRILTQMINLKPFRDFSFNRLICITVRYAALTTNAYLPVAQKLPFWPKPAGFSLSYFSPEITVETLPEVFVIHKAKVHTALTSRNQE